MPVINFKQLPRVPETRNAPLLSWIGPHITEMFTDRELAGLKNNSFDILMAFKSSLGRIFRVVTGIDGQKSRIVAFGVDKTLYIHFFVTGLYLNPSADSVVAAAYVFQMTPALMNWYPMLCSVLDSPAVRRDTKIGEVSSEELNLW